MYSKGWRMMVQDPLLAMTIILLVPLIPASVLYLVLTPRRKEGSGQRQRAKGTIKLPWWLGGMGIEFSVVGSVATYVVLLIIAVVVHRSMFDRAIMQEGVRDNSAWLVEVPVKLKSGDGTALPANNGEMQLVRVELEPSLTTATASKLQFWVVPNNKRFPTARFTLSNASLGAEVVDLNDTGNVVRNYAERRMSAVSPVWLTIGKPYVPPKRPARQTKK